MSERALALPILAYVAAVTAGVWVSFAIDDLQQGGDLLGAAIWATGALLGPGIGVTALLALLLVPAMVLTIELVHRVRAGSRVGRSLIGAAAWAAWCLFIAISLAGLSRIVLVPEVLAGDLALFAAAGAGFAFLAFDGHETRPGAALTVLALAVAVLAILGSVWMAGRWGGAA